MFNFYILLISIFFMSCATNLESNIQASSKFNSKSISSIPAEDAEECNSYRSWQLDYFKDKNYRRCIYCNMYTRHCILYTVHSNVYNIYFIYYTVHLNCTL